MSLTLSVIDVSSTNIGKSVQNSTVLVIPTAVEAALICNLSGSPHIEAPNQPIVVFKLPDLTCCVSTKEGILRSFKSGGTHAVHSLKCTAGYFINLFAACTHFASSPF